jgi:hypothetical protein
MELDENAHEECKQAIVDIEMEGPLRVLARDLDALFHVLKVQQLLHGPPGLAHCEHMFPCTYAQFLSPADVARLASTSRELRQLAVSKFWWKTLHSLMLAR